MEKLYKYIGSLEGIELHKETFRNSFFSNAPEVVLNAALVILDFTDKSAADIKNTINNNDKLETYCNKHDYVIYNKESVCLGLRSYFIASAAVKEKFAEYCSFKEAADAACKRYTREHTEEAPETVNKALAAIIEKHGTYYNEFLKATKEI